MQRQEPFDLLISRSLNIAADGINTPESMAVKVSEIVRENKVKGYRGHWSNIKKAAVAAACMAIISGGVSIGFLPEVHAWASEKATTILNRVQVIMETKKVNGGYMTSSEIKFSDQESEEAAQKGLNNKKSGIAMTGETYTIEAAEKLTGFKTKIPSYLPEGYKVPEAFTIGEFRKDVNGTFVSEKRYIEIMRFSDQGCESKKFDYYISQKETDFKPGFKYETIKIGNKEARWYETEITQVKDGGRPELIIERALSWDEDGLKYLLTDTTGLSKDELIKIVKSLH